MSSAATRSTSAAGSSVISSMTLGPFPSGRFQAGCPREPRGGSEAESRARGNNAGPLWQAPSARLLCGLLCGLSGTKHRRLQRAPHPIFTPQGVARDRDDSYLLSDIGRRHRAAGHRAQAISGLRLVLVALPVLALADVPLRRLDGTVDLLVVLM